MDHQNQNINPDYSFILDKPGPAEHKPRFSKKLVIGLVAVVVVFGGVILLSALTPKNYSTQATQTSLAYFGYIGQAKYETAYALLDTKGVDKKDVFVKQAGPAMHVAFKANNCVAKGTVKSGSSYVTTVSCPYGLRKGDQTFTLKTIHINNGMKITEFASVNGASNK